MDSSSERWSGGGAERSGLLPMELRFPSSSETSQDQPQISRPHQQTFSGDEVTRSEAGGIS